MIGSPRRRPRPGRQIDATVAARLLGVEVQTLRRWHARGAGPPAARIDGGGLVFWSSALEQWQERVLARSGTLPRQYFGPARGGYATAPAYPAASEPSDARPGTTATPARPHRKPSGD